MDWTQGRATEVGVTAMDISSDVAARGSRRGSGLAHHAHGASAVHIDGRSVLPIMAGDRPLGLYVVGDGHARWYPVAMSRHPGAAAVGLCMAAAFGGLIVGEWRGRTGRRRTEVQR